MATMVRGNADSAVQALKDALDGYEAEHPGAEATLYRYNPAWTPAVDGYLALGSRSG